MEVKVERLSAIIQTLDLKFAKLEFIKADGSKLLVQLSADSLLATKSTLERALKNMEARRDGGEIGSGSVMSTPVKSGKVIHVKERDAIMLVLDPDDAALTTAYAMTYETADQIGTQLMATVVEARGRRN